MIAIIDYESGNVASIKNMFSYLGIPAVITRDKTIISKSKKIVLPGVGAFDKGMNNLEYFGLVDFLAQEVLHLHKPILGICLGMQLLGLGSEEGRKKGLGWVDMHSLKFPKGANKVPHMGWNSISEFSPNPLVTDEDQRFYFVHSYYVKTTDPSITFAKTHHGIDFASGIASDNIYGVQFHPEKSHRYGMSLLSNFGAI